MTAQEAIKNITAYAYMEAENIPMQVVKAFDVAREALEKQIPKKPTFVDTRFRNHGKSISAGVSLAKCYKCPGCNTHIFHVFDDEVYCKQCGQKLDWGEQNEQT